MPAPPARSSWWMRRWRHPALRPIFNYWTITANGKTLSFFDGGTGGTANPAYEACVEAFEYDTFDQAQTQVIDLGTGY
jgi:hypothetical protein